MANQMLDALAQAMPYMISGLLVKNTSDTIQIQQLFMFLHKRPLPYLHNCERSYTTVEKYSQQFDGAPIYNELKWYTTSWGPVIWDFLHKLSIYFSCTSDRFELFEYLIMNLNYILPCNICAEHFVHTRDSGKLDSVFAELSDNPVHAVFQLHNIISSQIYPNRPAFTENEFSAKYKPL